MSQLRKNILAWAVRTVTDPQDDDEIRLRKSLLVVCAFPFVFAGVAWGLMYILLGELLAGMISLSCSVVSLLSIFRFSQLMLILLLPFFLMVTLGGFVSGSAAILRHEPRTIADHFEGVSILFADVVNFTSIVSNNDTDRAGGTAQRGIFVF